MEKVLIAILSLLIFVSSAAAANMKIATTADTVTTPGHGELVCMVSFAAGSSELTADAKAILNKNISRLKGLDLEKKMIRIEGFSSPEGDKAKNYRLSIDRARAVERFLRHDHGVLLDNYISGFGPTTPEGVTAAGKRSVQIVIYDNPWSQSDITVKTAGGQ